MSSDSISGTGGDAVKNRPSAPILFVRPGDLTGHYKSILRKAGIIVVECKYPSDAVYQLRRHLAFAGEIDAAPATDGAPTRQDGTSERSRMNKTS